MATYSSTEEKLMPIELDVTLVDLIKHSKEGKQPGGSVANYRVMLSGKSTDTRLPRVFDIPVTLAGGYFDDKDLVEITQARFALIAEALVAATATWKRDEAWFAARRIDKGE